MEAELYPIAVEIIKEATEGLLKRYVFSKRKVELGQIYYGLCCVPDIAIMDSIKNIY